MQKSIHATILSYMSTTMLQQLANVTAEKLYEDAFSIQFDWEKVPPPSVYKYHELIFKEINAPVHLQMGTVLPFVASCMGPKTKGLFFTQVTTLNLFWVIMTVPGSGKSQSC